MNDAESHNWLAAGRRRCRAVDVVLSEGLDKAIGDTCLTPDEQRLLDLLVEADEARVKRRRVYRDTQAREYNHRSERPRER